MYVSLRDRPGGSSDAERQARVASTVVLLGVVSMLTDVSSESVSAALPLYLTAQLGLGFVGYGIVDGLYQGISATVRLVGGSVGDRVGRPKWVAFLGYGLSAASRIALIPAHSLGVVTGVITADRLGKGLRTAPRDALIANASEPQALGRAFGVHRALDTLGAAIGPLLTFALLALVPNSYSSVFVVSFAFAVAGLAVLVLFVPDRKVAVTARPPVRRLFAEMTRGPMRRPLVAAALLGLLTVGDGFLYLSLQARDNFAAALFPLLYVGTNIAYLCLAVPLGRLADRIGRVPVLVGGHVALLGCYLLAGGPGGGAGLTVAVLLLLGTFYAATDGVLSALVSRLVPQEARGTGIAAAQTVQAAARFASSVGFGLLWVGLGRAPALFTVAALLAAGIPSAWWLLRASDPQ